MSEVYEVIAPSSLISLKRADGTVILEVEPFDLEIIRTQAVKGCDVQDVSNTQIWLERFRRLLEEEYDVKLTRTETWSLVEAVSLAMSDLKKKVKLIQTSQSSTESTPSV